MEKVNLPFSIMPISQLQKFSRIFLGMGNSVSKLFPFMDLELKQAELPFNAREYCAMIFSLCLIYAIIFIAMLTIIFSKLGLIYLGPVIGIILTVFIFSQLIAFPKIRIKKRTRGIEKNLPFALRTLLVQMRSGLTLYDSMQVVADKRYGELGKEFRNSIEKIATGSMEDEVLEEMSNNTSSLYFKRSVWQLLNGLKTGVDVSSIMKELVQSITKQQEISIRKYGSDLRILSLMYMMIGVILPSLGITFIIIIGSFPQVPIGQMTYWLLLIAIIIAQFLFLGIIKSKRPAIIEE